MEQLKYLATELRPTTAIVLFADNSLAEARSKRILPELNLDLNRQLLRYMTSSTLEKAHQTSLPVLLINRAQQKGNSFGSRIGSAFKQAFEAGYDNVLMVGNDCLDLSSDDFTQAAELLNSGKCVLGPDQRGGTWLIGLTKHSFEQLDFAQFNWQTARIFNELNATLGQENTEELLEKSDLNARHDLKSVIDQLKQGVISQLISFIFRLCRPTEYTSQDIEIRRITFVRHLQMRAPPSAFAA